MAEQRVIDVGIVITTNRARTRGELTEGAPGNPGDTGNNFYEDPSEPGTYIYTIYSNVQPDPFDPGTFFPNDVLVEDPNDPGTYLISVPVDGGDGGEGGETEIPLDGWFMHNPGQTAPFTPAALPTNVTFGTDSVEYDPEPFTLGFPRIMLTNMPEVADIPVNGVLSYDYVQEGPDPGEYPGWNATPSMQIGYAFSLDFSEDSALGPDYQGKTIIFFQQIDKSYHPDPAVYPPGTVGTGGVPINTTVHIDLAFHRAQVVDTIADTADLYVSYGASNPTFLGAGLSTTSGTPRPDATASRYTNIEITGA